MEKSTRLSVNGDMIKKIQAIASQCHQVWQLFIIFLFCWHFHLYLMLSSRDRQGTWGKREREEDDVTKVPRQN